MEFNQERIHTIRRLAAVLETPVEFLESIASKAGRFYSPFELEGRQKPFAVKPASTRKRQIDNPVDPLRSLQKQINKRLLRNLAWPDHIHGGVKGRSIYDNGARHIGASRLVTIDIKRYFSNINNRNVFAIWFEVLGHSPEVASTLTRLTTFRRRLPQGAATSPALANLFLFSIDEPLRIFCSSHGIQYSTWIDDLAFSGPESPKAIQFAAGVLANSRLGISHRKLKIMSCMQQQLLTGLMVNETVRVPGKYLKDIRSGIHKLRSGLVSDAEKPLYLKSLLGRIEFAARTNVCRTASLQAELINVLGDIKELVDVDK